jgi:ribosomal protein S12 methylthiotransferase accessory factor YcaO
VGPARQAPKIRQLLRRSPERDAVALWWYNRIPRPGVNLDSFGEPYLAELKDYLQGRHREMWALDLTSDLGIPTFMAASRRMDGATE